jgi:hypothetical protein
MKKRIMLVASAVLIAITLNGCATIRHTVGDGGTGKEYTSRRQWYALFGLVRIGEVNSKIMAGEATNYTVYTQRGIADILMNMVTGVATIDSQTITVSK